MPIYAYKCATCGHALDVLQKLSDAPLAVCPACGAASFSKQVTAAGFQLKGSGWYVTDFRDNGKKSAAGDKAAAVVASGDAAAPAPAPAPAAAASTESSAASSTKSESAASTPASKSPAPPPASS